MCLLDNGAASDEEGDITDIPCDYCFHHLFHGSTEITSVSEDFLPVTNLVSNCYLRLFQDCTSLTTAPELPATSLEGTCYSNMFSGCSSLNSIKVGYIGNYDSKYFSSWVSVVADSGAFYYNGSHTALYFGLLKVG